MAKENLLEVESYLKGIIRHAKNLDQLINHKISSLDEENIDWERVKTLATDLVDNADSFLNAVEE